MATDGIHDYYDRDPDREWTRLDRHPFEFPVTLHFLNQHLAPASTILDVGSGPGRYAVALAAVGHTVTAFDLVPALLDRARAHATTAGVKLAGFHAGSATDLSRYADASFDAVLVMGPMYHLTNADDRESALRESLRVLRAGGVLVVAFVSVVGRINHLLRGNIDHIEGQVDDLASLLNGPSVASTDEPGFTDAYFIQPDDIDPWLSRFPVTKLALFGAEGLTAQSETAIAARGERVTEQWVQFAIDTAATPAAVYASDHVTWIGRKS